MARESHRKALLWVLWSLHQFLCSCALYLKQAHNLQSLKHHHGGPVIKRNGLQDLTDEPTASKLWFILLSRLFFRTMCKMYSSYLHPLKVSSTLFGNLISGLTAPPLCHMPSRMAFCGPVEHQSSEVCISLISRRGMWDLDGHIPMPEMAQLDCDRSRRKN